jgi:hypothetical protein
LNGKTYPLTKGSLMGAPLKRPEGKPNNYCVVKEKRMEYCRFNLNQ